MIRAAACLFALGAAVGCRPHVPSPTLDTKTEPRVPDSASAAAKKLNLRVDLSELPAADVDGLTRALGLESADPAAGTVTLDDGAMQGLLRQLLVDRLVHHRLDRFDFYAGRPQPRLAYWENIVVQLPDFVRYGKFPAYGGYAEPEDASSRMLAYLVYRIDRNPEQLEALFERYETVVFGLIPAETYEASGLGSSTRGLLEAHDFIVQHDNYPAVMNEVDEGVRGADETDMFAGGRTADSYGIYAGAGLIPPSIEARFIRNGGGYSHNDEYTDVVWFSSFWLRRHREGNTEAVYEILQTIDAHYGRPPGAAAGR